MSHGAGTAFRDELSRAQFVALAVFVLTIFAAATFDPVIIQLPIPDAISLDAGLYTKDNGLLGRRIALPALAVVAAGWLLWRGIGALHVAGWLGILLLAALAWTVASIAWAIDPALTIRKVAVLACMWTGAIWVAALVPLGRLPAFTIVTVCVILLLCIGREIADSALRPFDAGYRFAGFYHPNTIGRYLAFGMLASVLTAATATRRALPLLCLAIFAIFLYLTKSRTSFLSVLVALVATGTLAALASRRAAARLAIPTAVVLAALSVAYVVAGDHVFRGTSDVLLMGRDASQLGTLTSRTPAWTELLDRYVSQRPLIGYGYDGFWTTEHIIAMSLLVPGATFFHSHSGYLELVLSVGIVGAVLHLGYMLLATMATVRQHLRHGDSGSCFAFGVLVMLLTAMLTEVPNFEVSLPAFITMVVVARLALVRRPRARQAGPVEERPCA